MPNIIKCGSSTQNFRETRQYRMSPSADLLHKLFVKLVNAECHQVRIFYTNVSWNSSIPNVIKCGSSTQNFRETRQFQMSSSADLLHKIFVKLVNAECHQVRIFYTEFSWNSSMPNDTKCGSSTQTFRETRQCRMSSADLLHKRFVKLVNAECQVRIFYTNVSWNSSMPNVIKYGSSIQNFNQIGHEIRTFYVFICALLYRRAWWSVRPPLFKRLPLARQLYVKNHLPKSDKRRSRVVST